MWPENWVPKNVAVRMMSQLNVGMAGVVGMRYEALPAVLHAMRVPHDDELDVLDALREIEAEVRTLINGRR